MCVFPVHFLSTFFFKKFWFVCCLPFSFQVVFEMENEREWSLVDGEIGKFWKKVREEKSGSVYIV